MCTGSRHLDRQRRVITRMLIWNYEENGAKVKIFTFILHWKAQTPRTANVISLSQIHMHSSRYLTIRCIIRTVFFSLVPMYIHLIHVKRHPLTQWTRAHYCWQIFALEPGAFVYPPALSTEAQFGRG